MKAILNIQHLNKSIQLSLFDHLPKELYEIEGMSSNKGRNFLNQVCKIDDFHYLEVGTWKGSTLIASLFNNQYASAYAIENWSQFGDARYSFYDNIGRYLQRHNRLKVIEGDCFTTPLNTFENLIDIYFYDGAHDLESQERALTYFLPAMANTFLYIVDDWNDLPVVCGTYQAIADLELEIQFMSVLPSRYIRDPEYFWNGMAMFLFKQSKI